MKNRMARFWYKLKNWFRTKPGPGEPLMFLCGSEEELRRVTMWACHLYPQVFENRARATVAYQATDDIDAGGGRLVWGYISSEENRVCMETCCELLRPWFALTFEYNEFTGTRWINPRPIGLFEEASSPGYRPGLPGYLGIGEVGFLLFVSVNPPSAHERAEALLSLSEWLDGKVSEEEKRELLQMV